MAEDLTP
jgi:hypothetical protein